MEFRLKGKKYRLTISDEEIQWLNEHYMRVPTKLVPQLTAMIPEKIRVKIEQLLQFPEEDLTLTAVAELTEIKRGTLAKRVDRGRLETYKERYRVVPKSKVLALILENRPVIEGWVSLQQIAERYRLCSKTITDWAKRGEIEAQKAADRNWYIAPSNEEIIEKRSEIQHQSIVEIKGERYLLLSSAIREIMTERGIPETRTRKSLGRLYTRIRSFNNHFEKRIIEKIEGRLFILESALKWLKKHPLIKYIIEEYDLDLETVRSICEENDVKIYGEGVVFTTRRVNQTEFEKALKKFALN